MASGGYSLCSHLDALGVENRGYRIAAHNRIHRSFDLVCSFAYRTAMRLYRVGMLSLLAVHTKGIFYVHGRHHSHRGNRRSHHLVRVAGESRRVVVLSVFTLRISLLFLTLWKEDLYYKAMTNWDCSHLQLGCIPFFTDEVREV